MSNTRKALTLDTADIQENELCNATLKLFNDSIKLIGIFYPIFTILKLELNEKLEKFDPFFLQALKNLAGKEITASTTLDIDEVGYLTKHLVDVSKDYEKIINHKNYILSLIEVFHEICNSRYGVNTNLISITFTPHIKLTVNNPELNEHFLGEAQEIIDKKDNNDYFFKMDQLSLLREKLKRSFKIFIALNGFLKKETNQVDSPTNTILPHSPPKDKNKNAECMEEKLDILTYEIKKLLHLLDSRSWTSKIKSYARLYVDQTPTAGKLVCELNHILNIRPLDVAKLIELLNERKHHISNTEEHANEQQIIETGLKLANELIQAKITSNNDALDEDSFVFVKDQTISNLIIRK